MENKEVESTVSTSREESLLLALKQMEAAQEASEEREIVRPHIKPLVIVAKKSARLVVLAAVAVLFVFLNHHIPSWWNWSMFAAVELVLVLAFFKSALTEWILLYQRFAPTRLRGSCRFEPSCSAYMLLAIEKYGAFKGFGKGVKRVCRCRYPNGGIDYP